jgi:hypothetical protein
MHDLLHSQNILTDLLSHAHPKSTFTFTAAKKPHCTPQDPEGTRQSRQEVAKRKKR